MVLRWAKYTSDHPIEQRERRMEVGGDWQQRAAVVIETHRTVCCVYVVYALLQSLQRHQSVSASAWVCTSTATGDIDLHTHILTEHRHKLEAHSKTTSQTMMCT